MIGLRKMLALALCLSLIFLYSCTKYIVIEEDLQGHIVQQEEIKSYSKSESLKSQLVSLRNGDYSASLKHCLIYSELYKDKKSTIVIYRAIISSLLRYDTSKNSLETLYNNNLYILETMNLLEQNKGYISYDFCKIIKEVLESGAQKPEAFSMFIESLKSIIQNSFQVRSSWGEDNFVSLKSNYPRWYKYYQIEEFEKWNFKVSLGL